MHNILIIRGGALGDFILTLPVIQTLKKNFPSSQIDLIGDPRYSLLAKNCVSRIDSLTDKKWIPLYVDSPIRKELKNYLQKFDLIISYIGYSKHVFNSHLKKIKGKGFIHCNSSPIDLRVHITEHLLTSLKNLKIKQIYSPKIELDKKAKKYALKFWEGKELYLKRVVAIHPGSGSTKKRWPLEKFVELANFLKEKETTNIIFVLGEAEYDLRKKLSQLSDEIIIISDINVVGLASILGRCSLYIGNDSGVTHLASALGIPIIALFGPTDPKKWGPKGEKVNIIYHKIPCSPCKREKRDACNYKKCIDVISLDEVKNLIDKTILS